MVPQTSLSSPTLFPLIGTSSTSSFSSYPFLQPQLKSQTKSHMLKLSPTQSQFRKPHFCVPFLLSQYCGLRSLSLPCFTKDIKIFTPLQAWTSRTWSPSRTNSVLLFISVISLAQTWHVAWLNAPFSEWMTDWWTNKLPRTLTAELMSFLNTSQQSTYIIESQTNTSRVNEWIKGCSLLKCPTPFAQETGTERIVKIRTFYLVH